PPRALSTSRSALRAPRRRRSIAATRSAICTIGWLLRRKRRRHRVDERLIAGAQPRLLLDVHEASVARAHLRAGVGGRGGEARLDVVGAAQVACARRIARAAFADVDAAGDERGREL